MNEFEFTRFKTSCSNLNLQKCTSIRNPMGGVCNKDWCPVLNPSHEINGNICPFTGLTIVEIEEWN